MNKKVKNIIISSTVVIIIAGILFFNKIRFIDGPTAIYSKIDQVTLEKFEEKEAVDNLKLVSRYALDEIVYTAKDNNKYYLFNQDAKLLETVNIDVVDFNVIDVEPKDLLVLSYYDQEVVFVVDNEEVVKLFDLKGSLIFTYKKRFDIHE